jgi:Type VI secretion system/phage-baseplate injector OB domain
MLRLGVVTDNQDPDNLRRVLVLSVDRGVNTSQWLPRVTGWDGLDSPVPPIGSSVVVADMLSDSTDGVVLGVIQSAGSSNNPIPDKDDQVGSWFGNLAGNLWLAVTGTWQLISTGLIRIQIKSALQPEILLNPNGQIRVSNKLGSITLLPNGYTVFVNPSGTWQINGSAFQINHNTQVSITSPMLTWNGQQVARIGGVDSDGDVTLS